MPSPYEEPKTEFAPQPPKDVPSVRSMTSAAKTSSKSRFGDESKTDQDRRGTPRFPLDQEIKYRILESRRHTPQLVARTVNMSSKGLCIDCDRQVPVGKRIELSVQWPAQLNETCGLRLVAQGRVVWSREHRFAVRLDKHEFRTQKLVVSPPKPDSAKRAN